jgi:energy-coupling factor transporter ATP-binding protein EcfA2
MINSVSIRNFKSLREVDVDLERFTVFVGPNASGKSSLLKSVDLLSRAFNARDRHNQLAIAFTQPYSSSYLAIETELANGKSREAKEPVDVSGLAGSCWYRYRNGFREPHPIYAEKTVWDGTGTGANSSQETGAIWKPWKRKEGSRVPIPESVLLNLEASKLSDPSGVGPTPSMMELDGRGLHSALASMTLNDPDSWQAVQQDLRHLIPTIRRLRHTRPTSTTGPTEVLFDTIGADSLPTTAVSEGTLLSLGLLTALHSSRRPNLALIDDLDRGLHPKAQKELVALLRRLLVANPDLQILATTHSPYLLDCMEPNEVRLMFLTDDGSSVCAPLTAHPKYPKWKDQMHPGELWSLFGEKWVAEKHEVPA